MLQYQQQMLDIIVSVITDANGCVDSVSILYGNNFSPNVNISLSNYLCDSLSSLTITL